MKNYNSYQVQYSIEAHLKEMFYRIPQIRMCEGITSDSFDSFEFNMDTADAKILSSATIKKWITSEFDMTNLTVRVSRNREVGFGGRGDYGYNFYITVSLKEA